MAVALLLLVSVSAKVFAMPVLYGAGTPEDPKRISTCFQLHNLLGESFGSLIFNQNYLITNNLDCTGYTFNNVVMLIDSSIDGGNHKITNIHLADSGFIQVMDNSTIKNLWFASGNNDGSSYFYGGSFANEMRNGSALYNVRSSLNISCNGMCAGLVGSAHDSTITKAVYDGTLHTGAYAGGLVSSDFGRNTNNLTISKSAFLGTMTAPSYAGGLIGSYTLDSSIEDSYINGKLDLGLYSGGIIGSFNNNILISKSYSSGTGTFSFGSGGIIGGNNNQNITVLHSYSVLNSFNNSSDIGNIEGEFNISSTYLDVHYLDESGLGRCRADSGTVSECRPMTVSQSDTISALLGFDLVNTWQLTVGHQPTLRLHQFGDPEGIPNNGDMNDDGTLDTFQGNIALLKNDAGHWMAIESKDTNGCTIGDANILDSTGIPKYSGYNIASDYLDFNIYCIDPGQSFTTNIILDRNIDISKAQLMFYNPALRIYTKINNATYSHKTIGGQTFTILSYTLTDGGPFDSDGISDGKIVDPVVLALDNTPSTVLGSQITNESTPNTPNTGAGQYTTANEPKPLAIIVFALFFAGSTLAYRKYFSKTKS